MQPRKKISLFLAPLWLILVVGATLASRAPGSPPTAGRAQRDAEAVAATLCQRLYQQRSEGWITASLADSWSVECVLGEDRLYVLIAADSGRVIRLAHDRAIVSSQTSLSPRDAFRLAGHWLRILGVEGAVFARAHPGNPYDLHFRCAASPCRIALDPADGQVVRFSHAAP